MRVKTSRHSWSQLALARAAWSCVCVDTAGSVSECQCLAISWHCVVVLKLQMKAHGNNLLDCFATHSNLSLAQTGSLRRHCGGHPSNPVCQCVEAHRAARRCLAKQTGDPSARYSSSSSSHGYTLSRYKETAAEWHTPDAWAPLLILRLPSLLYTTRLSNTVEQEADVSL